MRISDWSSDVCSSDLLESQPASRVQGGFCAVPWRPPRRSASRLRLRLQRGGRKDSWPAGRGERGPAWRPHRRRRPFEHHLARDPNPPTSGNSGPCTRRTTAVIAAGIAPGESLMPSPHWASASVRGLETTEPLLPRFRPNPLSHEPYPDPQTCCLPIIIKQVFAIAGKTLAEDVNVESGINYAIERIGLFVRNSTRLNSSL